MAETKQQIFLRRRLDVRSDSEENLDKGDQRDIITIHLNRRDFQILGKRRMFYLTDDPFGRLGVNCKKTGLRASEILRRTFDEYWERLEKKGRVKARE